MKKLSILIISFFMLSIGYAKENVADTIKTQEIEEVVIYSSRTESKLKELPLKVEIINQKAISNSGLSSVEDLLKRSISIDLVQYPNYSTTFGFRGFAPAGHDASYVKVLVDGIPSGTVNLSILPLTDIERIEVLKGPFSSLYGTSAMGGLVNIITKKNTEKLTGNISAGYGSFNLLDLNASIGGKIKGGFSFDAATFYRKSDDYTSGEENFYTYNPTEELILGKESYGKEMKNTATDSKGGNLRLGYKFNDNWSLDVYQSYFLVDDVATNGGFYSENPSYIKDIDRYSIYGTLDGQINRHNIKFNPYYNNENSEFNSPTTGNKDFGNENKNFGFQLQDLFKIKKHVIIFGLDNDNINYTSNKFDPSNGQPIAPWNPDYTNNSLGAFVQANFKLGNRINLTAGGRYDFMKLKLEANDFLGNPESSEDHSVFNPNVGLKIKIDKNTSIHANVGTAYLAPKAMQKAGSYSISYTWGGNTYNTNYKGNPDLDPEKSITYDIGIGYHNIAQGIDLDATYFNTDHKDKIVNNVFVDPDPSNWGDEYYTYTNASKGRMDGVELVASYDFGSLADYAFSLKAYLNTTLLFNADVKSDEEDAQWEELKYVRKHTGNFGLHFKTDKKWDIKLNGRYIGSRITSKYSMSPQLEALINKNQPQYAKKGVLKYPQAIVFDAHLYYNLTDNFTIGFNANNILDENYAENDTYNMPGRNFLGRVSYRF
ncbi:iron complex outermembrane receptor protein/vitamin B12 transporter [Balneicella halophila]|uniref:Iron complex outermembrane receptor protein/vitamin B12 transporter n=1 Tax=Balneicella halophila TaxID=1537566 RepID=A0A7L4UN83_BALHA|nr:TonB-dependent receptor [Balneicella halophila]PVX50002.1 iron complex outermembrane receptor protein/vitamin B12 transporter [Balneicella halophila]